MLLVNGNGKLLTKDKQVTHLFTIQTLGVDLNEFQTFSIYPSPTKSYINISSDYQIKIQIVDIQGKIIKPIIQTVLKM
ncbi:MULTISPECIES: hypothetical protein [Bizionia]|uniref:T9SS type A sorting domain-containing protein n=1 Tax=Bizionia algoritergicola TaxID=291187 RepID=A0A5D0R204_9FLAO|nr:MULTISPECIES: hypothetical protein [Bizionia]OBX20929.1 hypothetical protein BAA08_14720 [Bizionia sp. APA-3]TYB75015.1 hypothetical protein ES675_02455 [Bizionia algoritergicola]